MESFFCKSSKLTEELTKFGKPNSNGDYFALLKSWRKIQRLIKLESILSNLNSTLINAHAQNSIISQGLSIFIFETEEEINELKIYQSQIEVSPK